MNNQLKTGLIASTAFLSSLAFSQQAIADTYMYVTNTTPETVSVNINHYGTKTLTQGSQ